MMMTVMKKKILLVLLMVMRRIYFNVINNDELHIGDDNYYKSVTIFLHAASTYTQIAKLTFFLNEKGAKFTRNIYTWKQCKHIYNKKHTYSTQTFIILQSYIKHQHDEQQAHF
jgi:hypothetical protein